MTERAKSYPLQLVSDPVDWDPSTHDFTRHREIVTMLIGRCASLQTRDALVVHNLRICSPLLAIRHINILVQIPPTIIVGIFEMAPNLECAWVAVEEESPSAWKSAATVTLSELRTMVVIWDGREPSNLFDRLNLPKLENLALMTDGWGLTANTTSCASVENMLERSLASLKTFFANVPITEQSLSNIIQMSPSLWVLNLQDPADRAFSASLVRKCTPFSDRFQYWLPNIKRFRICSDCESEGDQNIFDMAAFTFMVELRATPRGSLEKVRLEGYGEPLPPSWLRSFGRLRGLTEVVTIVYDGKLFVVNFLGAHAY